MLDQSNMDFRSVQEWAQERWRRIRLEFTVELPLLKARWKQVLFGALFQYFHGMSTQLAHRMHRPLAQPLHDLGFEYLPELGLAGAWISEAIFWCLFIPFVLWTFSPFVTARKRFYTAVLYARLLMVLTFCQLLRIVSFTVTQLPAPNYHCHLGEPTAVLAWPQHWWQHIVVNVGRQATHGCGDLVFSSHTTFVLVGCLTFTEYGSRRVMKLVGWLGVAAMSLCIVASHKHYTVDVVVAWYVVPLVFYAAHRRWTTKRPVQDYWPHRPLVGEEGVEVLGIPMLTVREQGEGQPLLPVTMGKQHSRGASLRIADHKQGPAAKPGLPQSGPVLELAVAGGPGNASGGAGAAGDTPGTALPHTPAGPGLPGQGTLPGPLAHTTDAALDERGPRLPGAGGLPGGLMDGGAGDAESGSLHAVRRVGSHSHFRTRSEASAAAIAARDDNGLGSVNGLPLRRPTPAGGSPKQQSSVCTIV